MTVAIDMYSDYAEDLDTACCFLHFQEIKDLPRKTQKPDINLLVSGHAAQSASW